MSEFSGSTVESVVIEGLKKMELSQAVQEDHKMITAALPEAAIVSLTSQFLTMVLMRTAYSRVQLRIQIPEKYPDEVRIHPFHPVFFIFTISISLPLLATMSMLSHHNM